MPFSYSPVGMTRSAPPAGWTVDHNRVQLGQGEADYRAACAALYRWEMFNTGWTHIHGRGAPLEPGTGVGVVVYGYGLYFLNATRIVYTLDDTAGPLRRCGFAYGTLPGHGERGEELFAIEWRPDDSVWYDLLAYSRPAHWLARLGYPLARRLQKKFPPASQAAMIRAIRVQA